MKRTLGPGVTINTTCIRKDHKWRQKVTHVLGADICARRGCHAERMNPRMQEGLDAYWASIRARHGWEDE